MNETSCFSLIVLTAYLPCKDANGYHKVLPVHSSSLRIAMFIDLGKIEKK